MALGTWREDDDENKRLQELQKPGAMLFNRVERKQKVQLEDSTGFEDLQSQFDSADNRGRTVRKQVSDYNGLGSGRIIIKGKTNTPEGIFFYPDDPDFDKKAVESIEGWGRVFNAPAEFAPLLAIGVGGAKLLNQRGLNRAKTTFMKVDDDLNIADSFNITSRVDSALVKRSINFPKTQSTIKPGFVTDASGQLVSPGYDTGYRSFLQRGRNPTHYNIASQAKNMFNGGSVEGGGIGDLIEVNPKRLAGREWFKKGGGQDVEINKLLTKGRVGSKHAKLQSLEELIEEAKTSKGAQTRLD